MSLGGAVLASPKLVAITFDGDPSRDLVESFASSLGASDAWRAATREYGVGDLVAAPPVHAADAPSFTSDDAIESWLVNDVGASDPDAIYAVFYPEGTRVSYGGFLSCEAFFGYHGEIDTADGGRVAYFVVPRCAPPDGLEASDWLGVAASHEILEAATDPAPDTDAAYDDVDDPHAIWTLLTGGELADLCAGSYARDPSLPALVQRTWSNASARAGHDPCVPASGAPYVSAAPVLADRVTLLGRATMGARVALGDSRTIDVALASDAPAAPWDVSVIDVSEASGGPRELDLSLDRASGTGGDVLHLTITPRVADPGLGGEAFAIVSSQSGARRSIAYGFVAN